MIRLQGFGIVKFSRVRNSRWPPLLQIAKLIKSSFMLIDIKMKKSVAELGHNGRMKIYVDPEKNFTSTRAFNSISAKRLGIFGLNFVWSISRP